MVDFHSHSYAWSYSTVRLPDTPSFESEFSSCSMLYFWHLQLSSLYAQFYNLMSNQNGDFIKWLYHTDCVVFLTLVAPSHSPSWSIVLPTFNILYRCWFTHLRGSIFFIALTWLQICAKLWYLVRWMWSSLYFINWHVSNTSYSLNKIDYHSSQKKALLPITSLQSLQISCSIWRWGACAARAEEVAIGTHPVFNYSDYVTISRANGGGACERKCVGVSSACAIKPAEWFWVRSASSPPRSPCVCARANGMVRALQLALWKSMKWWLLIHLV